MMDFSQIQALDKQYHAETYSYFPIAFTGGKNATLIGTDGLSFGEKTDEQSDVHKILLGEGVVLLEGLCLDDVPCGKYMLVALPLKIAGSDGSPVRAVLIDE